MIRSVSHDHRAALLAHSCYKLHNRTCKCLTCKLGFFFCLCFCRIFSQDRLSRFILERNPIKWVNYLCQLICILLVTNHRCSDLPFTPTPQAKIFLSVHVVPRSKCISGVQRAVMGGDCRSLTLALSLKITSHHMKSITALRCDGVHDRGVRPLRDYHTTWQL